GQLRQIERGGVGRQGRVVEGERAELGRAQRPDVDYLLAATGVDADRVEQDQAADTPVVVAEGHLRGDPAADRAADHQDVGEVEDVEQVEVRQGQVVHAVEPVRPGRAVEAGVGRCQHEGVRC